MAQVRKVGQYELGETLGKGGYSWVKKGIDEATKHPVALKFMIKEAEKGRDKKQAGQVRTEIKSLIRINSPHVMKLYAYNLNCKYPEKNGSFLNTILLVLEYCPGGELFDILYYTQQLDAVTARTYFVQMMKGIKACHDVGIVHRDIKPQNLLMDASYQLKLTDFGLSFLGKEGSDADKVSMKTNYVGTRGYQAPELLKRQSYTKACDIFSAGVVLFILLTGYPPFEQAVKTDKWYKPLTTSPPDPAKFWKQHEGCGVDKDCQDMLSAMLAYKPANRLTMEEVLKHKWASAKTHTPKELAMVLKERHRETRKRRRRDKKKMTDMQNSIKKRRELKGEDVSKFTSAPQVARADHKPTLLTYYCAKADIAQAYVAASSVFELAFPGLTSTTRVDENPWVLATVLKGSSNTVHNTVPFEFEIATRVTQIKESGEYCISFSRIKGENMLHFGKVWDNVEPFLLAEIHNTDRTPIFSDDLADAPSDDADDAPAAAPAKFKPFLGEYNAPAEEDAVEEPAAAAPQAVAG